MMVNYFLTSLTNELLASSFKHQVGDEQNLLEICGWQLAARINILKNISTPIC